MKKTGEEGGGILQEIQETNFRNESEGISRAKQISLFCCQGSLCRERLMRWARYLLRHPDDAEDLCQEVCVRCILGQNRLKEQARKEHWLYHIMINACKDFRRRQKHRPEVAASEMDERTLETAQEIASHELWLQQARQEEAQEIVHSALDELPAQHKQLLVLRYLDGLSYKEIAQLLGLKVSSIDNSLRRARESFHRVYMKLSQEAID